MNNLKTIKARLTTAAEPYFSENGGPWLQDAMQAIAASEQAIEDLGLFSAMAKRKLGTAQLQQASDIDTGNDYPPVTIRRWSAADAGRLILLITAIERDQDRIENTINSYFKMGDEAEHIALIRGLIFFAPAEYLSQIALEAGRTNNLELLAALTLDNPYPACFYTEQQFNQMVLKALFLGLAIERVVGMEQRANADLTRMCENYVIEREKAGRSVPVDIWLGIGPFASEIGRQQIIDYHSHADIGHRYYCALALINRLPQDTSLLPILRQRLDNEQEPMISKLLQECLQASPNNRS